METSLSTLQYPFLWRDRPRIMKLDRRHLKYYRSFYMMLVRRQKNISFQVRGHCPPSRVVSSSQLMSDLLYRDRLYTGVIDGNKARWTYQCPPLDKARHAGVEGTLPKQVAGEKSSESYEADNRRASSKGGASRVAIRSSPVIDFASANARLNG